MMPVIFLVALVARAALLFLLDPGRLYWPDEQVYDGIAQGLAEGKGFAATGYHSTPLWPMFLALLYKLFGHSYTVARLAQAILGAATCALTAATARRLFDRRVAWCSGLALAIYPPVVYLAGVLYMENFFALWLALSTYALVRLSQQPTAARAALAGVCLGLAALSRSMGLMLIPFAALVPLLSVTGWRRRAGLVALIWLCAAGTIAPWTARNWATFHHFVPVSMGFGGTLWRGNSEVSRGDADDRFLGPQGVSFWRTRATDPAVRERIEQLIARLDAMDEFHADRALTAEALRYMGEHPARCALLYGKKLLTLHAAFSPTNQANEHTSGRNQFIATASLYPVLAFGLCGLALGVRRWRPLHPLYLVWGVFAFGLPLLSTCTRFRLPTDPLLIVFASAAAVAAWDRLAKPSSTTRRLAVVIGLGFCVRLAWCATIPNEFAWRDEFEYDAIARHLLDHDAYSITGEQPTAFRAPGQPLFMAAAYSLDRSPAAVRVWQSLLWAVAIWLAFKVAREAGATERAALWAAAAVAVYPFYIYAAGTLFPVTLFTVTLLLATWGLLHLYNNGGCRLALLAGAALGAGTLMIPYLLPSALLVPLWLGRRRWRESACVAVAALLVVAPWPLRNWATFGSPVMGTQQGLNLWYGNNPQTTASSGSNIRILPRPLWIEYRDTFKVNELAADRLLAGEAWRNIRENPARAAWLWAAKALNFFRLWPETQTHNQYTTLATKLAGALTFGPVLVLGLIGWWRSGLDRRRAAIVVIYFACFVAVAAVTISKDRFRIPLDVYLMIFAAAVVERWFSRYKSPPDTGTTRPC
ncbi:MAG: glycosyltransferase family 39 protein [Verrucomicrobia bacterium]|nr:glycosyltransferase family 39 protein [Verrucomicrobiota bacterium]